MSGSRVALCCILILSSTACGVSPLAKDEPLDVRYVAYNVNREFISNSSKDAAFRRVLVALSPDVLQLEEMGVSVSAPTIASRLASILGGSWNVHDGLSDGYIRTVIASRFPLVDTLVDTTPASSTRGVTIARVDLPDAEYVRDLYLLGVHLKCCGDVGGSEDASRQRSADAIASWIGDARRPGGRITLARHTPMIVAGDFNLVGGPQPGLTILTGDILDEATFGHDIKGDWDDSDLTDLTPLDLYNGSDITWQGDGTYDPSRLDRFFYTDGVTVVERSFVLNSKTMPSQALTESGLRANDTLPNSTSDHLPIVMDVRFDCNNNGVADTTEPDADGDGVPDDCDGCGATPAGLPVDLGGCPAAVLGDLDSDLDVDLDDFAVLAVCFNGSTRPIGGGCAAPADFDGDGDVDLDDFAIFTACFNGAAHVPACHY